ncbi:hypothetical protein OPT61_g8540 [Boeremia exigua]|uniref:Uncharacterized protein n=1 Tax=Boeremia exigua TaxID=749465 RepID=A0ACC2HYX5_9PLEO|nr:hypothetical protein OPT61_g8540 [Boeremia exigua]
MLEACRTCSLAVHNPFVEGVVGVVRRLDRTPATGESAMFVGTNAFVAVEWVRLLMGSRQLRFELRRTAGYAQARAHGGAVGTARYPVLVEASVVLSVSGEAQQRRLGAESDLGRCTGTEAKWTGDGKNAQSRGPLRVGKSPFQGFTQSKGTANDVYTVKGNRQLVRGTDTRAIGGGRGVACVGGRAIGGDALAMQVHARRKETYQLESARHMHVANARLVDDCAGEVTLAGVGCVGLCSLCLRALLARAHCRPGNATASSAGASMRASRASWAGGAAEVARTEQKQHGGASRWNQPTARHPKQTGVLDLRMQQAAAEVGHEILWWSATGVSFATPQQLSAGVKPSAMTAACAVGALCSDVAAAHGQGRAAGRHGRPQKRAAGRAVSPRATQLRNRGPWEVQADANVNVLPRRSPPRRGFALLDARENAHPSGKSQSHAAENPARVANVITQRSPRCVLSRPIRCPLEITAAPSCALLAAPKLLDGAVLRDRSPQQQTAARTRRDKASKQTCAARRHHSGQTVARWSQSHKAYAAVSPLRSLPLLHAIPKSFQGIIGAQGCPAARP